MKLGIIGAGAIASKHLDAAIAIGVPVSYIVDPALDRAEELATKCGAAACETPDELWNSDVTGVIIATPNCFHAELAKAALQHGKDILLEKPMGLNASECQAIVDAATAADRLVQIGFAHRHTPIGLAMAELAKSGELGDIYHAKSHLYFQRGVPGLGRWFTNRSMSGGGALIDVGVHLIDLAMHIMDFPKVTHLTGNVYRNFGVRMRDYIYESMWAGPPNYDGVCDVEDSAHALIRFENGATLDLNVAWAGNFPAKALPATMMGFFGDQAGATFELFGDHLNVVRESAAESAGDTSEKKVVENRVDVELFDQMRHQLESFLRAIETRTLTGASGEQGLIVQSIIDGIYHSSETGEPVTFD